MILNAQKRSLKEMELKDLTALFLAGSGKYREFNKKVNDKLPNSWNYYYSVYEIIYGSAAVDIEMEYIEEKRVSLNNKSKDKMSKVFGIDEEESNEKRLTEVLIDLIKYDLKLDEQIIKKYEENRENKNKLIEEEQKKVIKLEKVRNKIERNKIISLRILLVLKITFLIEIVLRNMNISIIKIILIIEKRQMNFVEI